LIEWGNGVNEGVVAADHNGLRGDVVLGEEDGKVIVSVVIVGSGFSGKAHASEGSELSVDVGFQVDVEVNEGWRNGEAVHFEAFEDHGLAMLGLVESGVVIGEVRLVGEMVLAPLRELERCVPGVDVDIRWAILIVEDALVLFDWAQKEDDGVVHEG